MTYKLTYSTMFNPPEELHQRFESALAEVREGLGAFHAMHIGGKEVRGARTRPTCGPVDQRVRLGEVSMGSATDVDRAVGAARQAFDAWRRTPMAERLALVRRVAGLIEERVYAIGAALALEVGKNRMEALGEAAETAAFFTGYADEFERNGGYDRAMPDDPLEGWVSHNRSVLKPHGVWAVIAPFNYPMALAGGPTAAALVTGNTVVLKGASDTPWAGRLLADCIRDAGVPPGVFNYVTGSGAVVGDALIRHPEVAGATFTGSFDVGMGLLRSFATGRWPRPCITELGGKNPCVVSAHGDLDRASTGIVRSAYGMSGQKCSALSRVYVEASVADELLERVVAQIQALTVGDPTSRPIYMGPVISRKAAASFDDYCRRLRVGDARILVGGARLADPELAHGHFVAPTLAEAPTGHALFEEEMFVPILMVSRVGDFEEGLRLANASRLGLTAGCYGSEDEVRTFLDRIEAGVIYLNRPQGATTGAWPGYQAFGGWKGSGSTGKAIGSFYYLPQYLREQSQTWVE